MTWCIFIATNHNFLFTHKQRTGKIDSGLKAQPSFTLLLGTAEKMAAKRDSCPVYMIQSIWSMARGSHFPYLNPVV